MLFGKWLEIELFQMQNAECKMQNGKRILNSTFLILHLERGCSSVGRAVALQAIGQEFESPQLHHLNAECRMQNAEFFHSAFYTLDSALELGV